MFILSKLITYNLFIYHLQLVYYYKVSLDYFT